MSNIQLHAIPMPAGRSLPLCLPVSLPSLPDLLLICPLKIRNGLNPMKTNDKRISNLSAFPANALRAPICFISSTSSASEFRRHCFPLAAEARSVKAANRNSSLLEFRPSHRKQSLVPKSNRNKTRISPREAADYCEGMGSGGPLAKNCGERQSVPQSRSFSRARRRK